MTPAEHELISSVPELGPLLAALDGLHDALAVSVGRREKQLAQRILHLVTQVAAEIDQIMGPPPNDANADPESRATDR
jgi:hypothetical protein